MKRVVVTGLGVVSPIGITIHDAWQAAIAGRSGIRRVEGMERWEGIVRIAGTVPEFSALNNMNERELRRSTRFVQMAVVAAKLALEDARLPEWDREKDSEVGVSLGVGVGGLGYMEEQITALYERGARAVSPFSIPYFIANMAAGLVSMETNAKGPSVCTTTACASGTHAIGDALMSIQTGRAKVMIAGGAESTITPFAFAGFGRMKALCTEFQDEPHRASRPFDNRRAGFVMGEGSGILILEEAEHAIKRGARIYCELVGFGSSSDAFHITQPSPGGAGAALAIKQALVTGGLKPEDVQHINAHGTSTEANDALETQAIKSVFGKHAYDISICSTKSMTGHLLGAAGGVEAAFSVLALHEGIIPPTINQEEPDPACDLNYTPNKAVKREIDAVVSNSFGFGGTNACLAFKKFR